MEAAPSAVLVPTALYRRGVYYTDLPGGHRCGLCNFRFSNTSLLELHQVTCADRHLTILCNFCGQQIHHTTYDDHAEECAKEMQKRLEIQEREERAARAVAQVARLSPPEKKKRPPQCPDPTEYNGELKGVKDESTLFKLADHRSLMDIARKNHFHAEAVIYDNYEERANQLEDIARSAASHWYSPDTSDFRKTKTSSDSAVAMHADSSPSTNSTERTVYALSS